jgi:hypothetical protein
MQAFVVNKLAQPLSRKTALLLTGALGVLTTFVGNTVGFVRDYGRFSFHVEEAFRGILGSICMSWFILPCGFLYLVSGNRFLLHDVPIVFICIYDGVVLLLLGGFVWLRRWWPFIGAAILLLVGAGGCAGFVSSIDLAK